MFVDNAWNVRSPMDADMRRKAVEVLRGAPRREPAGIVQPPVHAVAALAVHRAAPALGRRFLRHVYPGLKAQNDYLLRERAHRTGLVTIVHPWESGQDNSPAWDAEL